MKKVLKNNATLIALFSIVIIFFLIEGIYGGGVFLDSRNLSNITLQVTIKGIIAIGMTLVILTGGIDLSVGSIVGISAIFVTTLMQKGVGIFPSIILTLLVTGIGLGAWNGFLIAKYKIPPFIITLGMMTIARGLALTISNGSSIPVAIDGFDKLGGAYIGPEASFYLIIIATLTGILALYRDRKKKLSYGIEEGKNILVGRGVAILASSLIAIYVFCNYKGIPVPVSIFIVLILISNFVLKNTRFGRGIYAVGGNEDAARLSGINVLKVTGLVYTIITTLSALSGILLTSRLNGASPNLGHSFELDAIAAVVIGGTSLNGGRGTIMGTIIGTLIIGILNNGMSLLGVSSFYQLIVKGLIIILAVWFDVVNKKKKV